MSSMSFVSFHLLFSTGKVTHLSQKLCTVVYPAMEESPTLGQQQQGEEEKMEKQEEEKPSKSDA